MIFVNFSLIFGSLLVGVPIVLHLIMRRKPKLLEFPALRLIQTRHDANQRRLRLRHLLLLLLRMAIIALLAFALARPSMRSGGSILGSQEAPVAAALIFDAAPRMAYRHENKTRLEVARQWGLSLLPEFPPESQLAVFDTRLGGGGFAADRGVAKQRISRLETVTNSQPLVRVVQDAVELLAEKSELPRKEIYVFTDLAAAAWPAETAAALQDRLAKAPGASVCLIDVGIKDPVDFSLGEVHLSHQVLSNLGSLDIDSELSCIGPGGQRTVELLLDDAKREQKTFALPPGGAQQTSFHVEGLGIGTHQGLLRIVGQDGLAADDTRYFTVEVKPPWRILIAAAKPAAERALFLSMALAPAISVKEGRARFDCQVIGLDELPRQALDGFAAVCLVDPAPLEPAVWQKLADYAAEGHGVAIFLGRNAHPLAPFNLPAAQRLLPGKLLRQARRPEGDVYLAPRALEHPVLADFRGRATEVPWDDAPVFRYWELEPPPAGVGVVMPFLDGRPALLERAVGNGRVLTMTTPVSDAPKLDRHPWNLLPVADTDWPFVILMNGMISYLVGGEEEQLNYVAGQPAVLPLDEQTRQQTYVLTAPGLKSPQAADLKKHALIITTTEQPGQYRLQAGGKTAGVDLGFSVNLAPEQTQLQRITEKQLQELFGPFKYQLAHSRDEIDRSVSMARVGGELFPSLILLVVLVLAAECLIANRFYKE
ncbi:MAG: BatA domain-containing protein [Thermoguttaceae bacterium]